MSKKKYIYVVMAALCMLFILILPLGHDLHFHIYRIGAMAEELERTGFSMPIRILSVLSSYITAVSPSQSILFILPYYAALVNPSVFVLLDLSRNPTRSLDFVSSQLVRMSFA